MAGRDPVADLRRIAYLLESAGGATYRVRAFRGAAAAIADRDPVEVARLAADGKLRTISGVGDATARCIEESLRGQVPTYLRSLPPPPEVASDSPATALRAMLLGDCHSHSDWSDGGSSIEEMALAAVGLGHEYLVMTDHSPRLRVARGLSAERLRQQLDHVAGINAALPSGFRILTGIEVDILADGSLDQDPALLGELDVVVGSLHSGLKDPADAMTHRMLTAIANPHLDILGHCTGRKVAGDRGSARGAGVEGGDRAHRSGLTRAESAFDAPAVFAACAEHDKAVEINCRPDRLDPPIRLLRLAAQSGCRFAVDTDAHAPGQLEWLINGCERAARCDVPADRIVNTWPADALVAWAASHA
ncbi:MAG: PHP domain-containing protein [Frankia sp.]